MAKGFSSSAAARAMLARLTPLPRWIKDNQPTPEVARIGQTLVREIMALAALTPDEEELVRNALGIDDATDAVEAGHVSA